MQIEIVQKDGFATPCLSGTNLDIGALVHACHDKSIDEALAKLQVPGLERETLEPVLDYCARLRCEDDASSCSGCRRRSNADGVHTLDDFIARRKEIIVDDGRVTLCGQGEETLKVPSLEALQQTWEGESYWFWARRVIRKLRHGLRRANKNVAPFAGAGETPSVILVAPQLADNIGMVARAMANFGLDEMRLVAPRDGWPNERARVAASGANYVIDGAEAHDNLEQAVGDLNWVCATTARQRDLTKPVMTPAQAVEEMVRRIACGQRCGVLFGRENNGLTTPEIAIADAAVMIPVNSRFASLNLAQAVLILGYSWILTQDQKSLGRVTHYEKPIAEGLNVAPEDVATREDVFGFFEHLENELERLGFFYPPERREAVVNNIRTMFLRLQLTRHEVRTLRGIVATLALGKGKARK